MYVCIRMPIEHQCPKYRMICWIQWGQLNPRILWCIWVKSTEAHGCFSAKSQNLQKCVKCLEMTYVVIWRYIDKDWLSDWLIQKYEFDQNIQLTRQISNRRLSNFKNVSPSVLKRSDILDIFEWINVLHGQVNTGHQFLSLCHLLPLILSLPPTH